MAWTQPSAANALTSYAAMAEATNAMDREQGKLDELTLKKLDIMTEGYKASNVFGQAAFRAAMIINGAAAIALLAYLGQSDAKPCPLIPCAMLLYVLGVAAAATASICAYLAAKFGAENYEDDGPTKDEVVSRRDNWATGLVIAALSLFVLAGILAFLHFILRCCGSTP